jgi:hypothetical protein
MARGMLEDIGVPTDSAYTLLKRDEFDAFRDGVIEKVHRKKYKTVAEMDDIARGRFNVPNGDAVRRLVQVVESQTLFELVDGKAQGPKDREGVKFGYPRYHTILRDKRTGLTFEWQIGTRMTTQFFEVEGIDVHGLKLKEGMHRNIHDIEYDIFKYLQDKNRPLADELGIPAYRREVAAFAERTYTETDRITPKEFDSTLAAMHARASAILKALLDHPKGGAAYVQTFFH